MHLRADFPNNSPWPDWAKYTDEGWYGSAAIRHYQLGQWNLPGDFNPAAALPVWPLLELLLFHFTGVSLLAARALTVVIFGLTLQAVYLLLRRSADNLSDQDVESTRSAPAIAVLLLAASPFYFAFSRLAILEPLLLLLALVALRIAEYAGEAATEVWPADVSASGADPRHIRASTWAILLGIIVAAMVLTKTTGIFLIPSVAWMLWSGCEHRLRTFLRVAAISVGAAAISWGGYMLLFVRPLHMADYRYLFSANEYTGISRATFWPVIADAFVSGNYLGITFFWPGIAALAITLTARRLRANALAVSLLLWIFIYFAFLAYHDNLQPRYYYVLGVPLAMLIALSCDTLLQLPSRLIIPATRKISHLAAIAMVATLSVILARGAAQQIAYVAHPEYTFLTAAHRVRDVIESQRAQELATGRPVHPQLLLSISNANISLVAGLPSICDDFGTMTLQERITTYKPGWYVAWNDVEDDKMEALAPMYRLVRVGAWPAFDDPDRNLLILYRLDPLDQPRIGSSRRRTALNIPRQLRRVASASSQVSH